MRVLAASFNPDRDVLSTIDYGKILALMRRDPKDCSRDVPQE
jgi:hypothetical protein